ncbi:MAG: hypothetical protein FWC41_00430 [Firmicutes bacterium]|nr:hypothetical protein [Bacillota bacterium]
MKANLKIERIGGEYSGMGTFTAVCKLIEKESGHSLLKGIPKYRDWVAKITGQCPKYKYSREFLKGKVDYTKSNSVGTRGIFVNYILEEEYIYEVSAPASWKRTERYFCKVINEDIIKIDSKEVEEWLKSQSE